VFASGPGRQTVPSFAANAAVPHDALSGKATTLKGTSSVQGADIQATWDFGDSSKPFVFTVLNQYDVSAAHVYSGSSGAIYTATLTILNKGTGEASSSS